MAGFWQYLYMLQHLTGWTGLTMDHGVIVYGGSPLQAFLTALAHPWQVFVLTA